MHGGGQSRKYLIPLFVSIIKAGWDRDYPTYVTGSEKTRHIVNSMKFELAVLLNRANRPTSLRPIARFALELERFVHDHATPTENEKLRSKGVAMHTYGVSVYYA